MVKPLNGLILISSPEVDTWDKVRYFADSFIRLAPIVFLLDQVSLWTTQNKQFAFFMWLILTINMIVGIVFHLKNKSFDIKEFLSQNALMAFIVGSVLIVLETFRYTAGDNLAGEIFRVFTQTLTLFYPASKILKNAFILSNGQYPPEFIMRKLYNFRKNGDLAKFFSTDKVEIIDDEDFKQTLNNNKS